MNPPQIQEKIVSRSEWFDNLIATLKTHELQLETNTAPDEMKQFYNNIMSANFDEVLKMQKAAAQKYFVGKIIVDFLKLLNKNMPLKLAFDFNDAEVLVWAEIENNNERQERLLRGLNPK